MESAFPTLLIDWLRSDIQLSASLNAVQEEGPSPAPAPTLSIAASASADWSTKTCMGREVRLALELLDRSDQPETSAAIAARIEQRIATMAPEKGDLRIVSTQFLRSRVERRARSIRAVLLEYQFRILSTL